MQDVAHGEAVRTYMVEWFKHMIHRRCGVLVDTR